MAWRIFKHFRPSSSTIYANCFFCCSFFHAIDLCFLLLENLHQLFFWNISKFTLVSLPLHIHTPNLSIFTFFFICFPKTFTSIFKTLNNNLKNRNSKEFSFDQWRENTFHVFNNRTPFILIKAKVDVNIRKSPRHLSPCSANNFSTILFPVSTLILFAFFQNTPYLFIS